MDIREERSGDIQIVVISDHLDTATAPTFEERLFALLESGARQLLIDCAPLQYVNSAGLKSLLLVAKKIEALGGQLVLCSLAASVLTVFEMIGFNRIMKIIPTRAEALLVFGHAAAV